MATVNNNDINNNDIDKNDIDKNDIDKNDIDKNDIDKNDIDDDIFTLDELSARRGGGAGGHYNAKTRRLTLARKVLTAVGDAREVYIVFGKSRRAIVDISECKNGVVRRVHSVQCFVTVPSRVAKSWGDSGDISIEYRLGTTKK